MKQKKIISENAFKQVVFRGDGNLEMEGYENVWNIKRKNTKKISQDRAKHFQIPIENAQKQMQNRLSYYMTDNIPDFVQTLP